MARCDLERLRRQGYAPTDEDVVRLNDLALRIERGRETTVASAPRSASAGNVTLFEPTYAALEWWHSFGRDAAWTTRGKIAAHFFMLAHSRRPEVFDRLTDAGEIRRAVRRWKRTVGATEGELWRALLWVRRAEGEDLTAEARPDIGDSLADEESLDRLYRVILAAAGAMGVAPSSLRTETPSALVQLLLESNLHAKNPMKVSVARDYMAYQATVRAIESRKAAGE